MKNPRFSKTMKFGGATLASALLASAVIAPQAMADNQVNLVMTIWGSTLDTQTYQQRADQFTKSHPNVHITVKNLASYDQQVQTMIAGGNSPDIMEMNQGGVGYGANGAVVDLTPYITSSHMNLAKNFVKGEVNYFQSGGNTYALPDRGGWLVMYYNEDLFKKAHVAPPTANWTWSNMLAAAKKLTVKKGGKTVQYGFADGVWWPEFLAFMHAAGGEVLSKDGKTSIINQPAAMKGLQFWNDLEYKYHVAPSPTDYAAMGTGVGNPDNLFQSGKAAMMITGLWDVSGFAQKKLHFGLAAVPGDKSGAMIFMGTGLAIASQSQHKDLDWQVVQFMTSAAGQRQIAVNQEDVPSNPDMLKLWEANLPKGVDSSSLLAGLKKGDVFSPVVVPQFNQVVDTMGNDLNNYFDNKQSLKDAVNKAAQDIDGVLAGGQ